jgi:hypothetical protein
VAKPLQPNSSIATELGSRKSIKPPVFLALSTIDLAISAQTIATGLPNAPGSPRPARVVLIVRIWASSVLMRWLCWYKKTLPEPTALQSPKTVAERLKNSHPIIVLLLAKSNFS